MYNKFSIVEFTNTTVQTSTCLQNGSSIHINNNQAKKSTRQHVSYSIGESTTPKKRGRPAKSKSHGNQMVIKSTESFFQPMVFSNHQTLPTIVPIQKKRKFETNVNNTLMSDLSSSSNTDTSIDFALKEINKQLDQSNVVVSDSLIGFERESLTKSLPKRIVRTSISIKELLN